mmetsp:Transcript_25173/g.70560  ORF Transcript_25173/g.70560 Transcript_25173/m.70560 type:complete len:524 (-) Transcript_25173:320-1891(-)
MAPGVMERLDPVPPEERTWGVFGFARLWVAMNINPLTLVLGSGLLNMGLSPGGVVGAAAAGAAVTLASLVANAWAGCQTGAPFPVYARAAFGTEGAKLVALVRGLVAIAYLGLQTWVGTLLLYYSVATAAPSILDSPRVSEYLNCAQLGIFVGFLLLHLLVLEMGMHRLGPLLKVTTVMEVGGLVGLVVMALLDAPPRESFAAMAQLGTGEAGAAAVVFPWGNGVNAMVSTWSTLVLNIVDLSRFSKSQRAQVVGQALGFPVSFVLMVACGMLVAASNFVKTGAVVWDLAPILYGHPPGFAIPVGVCMMVGVLDVNVVANMVSPGNDIANLWPEKITYRWGARLSLALSALCLPWRIFASPDSFIHVFLGGYALLTGAMFGVMAWDYHVLRCRRLDVAGLYAMKPGGMYRGWGGFNLKAWAALGAAAAVLVPGFCASVGVAGIPRGLRALYDVSWFASAVLGVAFFEAGVLALGAWNRAGRYTAIPGARPASGAAGSPGEIEVVNHGHAAPGASHSAKAAKEL